MLFSSFPLGLFQWPITPSTALTFNLHYIAIFTTIDTYFTSLSVFIQTHPVNFPVGGNWNAGENPRLNVGKRVLTNSFHMSGILGSSNTENVLTENRTRNLEVTD